MGKPLLNYAFIDGQNFFTSVGYILEKLEALEVEFDFSEFRTYLKEKHGVDVARYFIGYVSNNAGLYRRFRRQGYSLVFKEVATTEDGIKGNVDVNLTLQTMIDLGNFEKAVIVTSDGDYACLTDHLYSLGKLECLIACSRGGCSYLLRKRQNKVRIYYLDDIIRDLHTRRETS